jgi:ATP-binding cassette subfamily B protein
LDNESEKVVQDSLEKLAKNRTTFVIAHRLSTIKNAKKILVLTEEGIKETGTHDELLKQNGITVVNDQDYLETDNSPKDR